jgi:hypothetical protein
LYSAWLLKEAVEYMENYGGWPQLPSFENHGFIFWKRRTMETMTMTREATPAERFSV